MHFLVRACLAPWVSGLAFLTFYRAVLIAALFGGWRAGAVTLVLGVLAGSFLWLTPVASSLWGVGTWVAVVASLAFGCVMIAAIAVGLGRRVFLRFARRVEPKREKSICLSMFSDKETLIVEACLFIAVPVSVGLAVLSALLL